ncbi:MAG: transposase [Saprospiraceae bacterium]
MDYYQPLLPDSFYHVYNRGNNRENIFYRAGNAAYFLEKYTKYMIPVLDTYTYCLLPNHFHLLVRTRSVAELLDLPGFQNLEGLVARRNEKAINEYIGNLISDQFRLLFMSYAKAINKQEGRVGSLFQKNFKRLRVESVPHLVTIVQYIHANPQLHGLCGDFRDWADSSYSAMVSESPTKLKRPEVLEWFGNRDELIHRHREYMDWKTSKQWLIEDEE